MSPSSAPPPDDPSCLRADARRNRDKLIDAAREVFAERGLDATLEEVARRAGVGVGTLYRRFPTREDLVACAFEAKMAEYVAAIDEALADPDPWAGFCRYIEQVCAMQAADRGFTDVLTLTFPTQRRFEAQRAHSYRGAVTLIERAKAAGRLRSDFVPEDLVMVLMANAGVVAATVQVAPQAWRRLVGYLLQAFATHGDPLPDPPAPGDMERALRRLDPDRRR